MKELLERLLQYKKTKSEYYGWQTDGEVSSLDTPASFARGGVGCSKLFIKDLYVMER